MSTRQAWLHVIYWTCLLAMVWWQMQVVHEAGHIVAALLLSETIAELNLHHLQLSHTLLVSHHYSAPFLWAGPLCGVLLPIMLWQLSIWWKTSWSHVLRFFSGFCLIANGAYLGSAAFNAVGDAKGLLQQQVSPFWLFTFAAVAIPIGFWLWNGQGPKFGLGGKTKEISRSQILKWVLITTLWFVGAMAAFPFELMD